jgi:hypothetical protein
MLLSAGGQLGRRPADLVRSTSVIIRVAINWNAEALHDVPNLPNDARDGESHILPRCLGLGVDQTSERSHGQKASAQTASLE